MKRKYIYTSAHISTQRIVLNILIIVNYLQESIFVFFQTCFLYNLCCVHLQTFCSGVVSLCVTIFGLFEIFTLPTVLFKLQNPYKRKIVTYYTRGKKTEGGHTAYIMFETCFKVKQKLILKVTNYH